MNSPIPKKYHFAIIFATFAIFTVVSEFGLVSVVAAAQQNHINSFVSNVTRGRSSGSGGCRRPSAEVFGIHSKSVYHKVAVCKSLKPIKPARVMEMSKSLCATNWIICNHLEKGIAGLSWNKMPKGCFGFKFGDVAKKASGYGSKCHKNLYFDGILCCPVEKHLYSKKYNSKQNAGKHYLLTNEIH